MKNGILMTLAGAGMAVVAMSASSASAGLILNGTAGSGWQAFPGALNNYANDSRPYWDQRSMDGNNRNIGNYVSGTYGGSLPSNAAPSPAITPMWWSAGGASPSNSNVTMDNDLSLSLTGGTSVATTLRLEVAGRHAQNEIGWYDLSAPIGSEVFHTIFSGPATAVTSATFTPSTTFGLYLKSGGNVMFTQSARNRGGNAIDRETQHFAFFATDLTPGAESYLVGVEDLYRHQTGVEGIGDFNDVVFSMTAVPAPGAATLALIGLGLIGSRSRRK
jgi:hypothetical protein